MLREYISLVTGSAHVLKIERCTLAAGKFEPPLNSRTFLWSVLTVNWKIKMFESQIKKRIKKSSCLYKFLKGVYFRWNSSCTRNSFGYWFVFFIYLKFCNFTSNLHFCMYHTLNLCKKDIGICKHRQSYIKSSN